MSIEDLMKPRYKVIADYPVYNHTPKHEIGSIITFDKLDETYLWKDWGGDGTQVSTDHFDKYPAIFRPLAWWEEREEKDMPEYVKMDDRVWRITKWERGVFKNWLLTNKVDDMPDSREKGDTGNFASIHWYFKADRSLPATAEEYEQYIKQKQK